MFLLKKVDFKTAEELLVKRTCDGSRTSYNIASRISKNFFV